MGHPLGPAPKKSLAIQARRMALPGVGAVLADLTAPVVGAVQPANGLVAPMEVVPEDVVQSVPLET